MNQTPEQQLISQAMAILGRKGGKATTPAKRKAGQANIAKATAARLVRAQQKPTEQ